MKKIHISKDTRKKILKLLLVLAIGVAIGCIFLLIAYLTGIIYVDGGIKFNAELFNSLKNSPWLYVAFMGVSAIGSTLLCMNPLGTGLFTWLGIALFGANWKCFLATFGACFLSYILIDAVGRFGGSKIIIKIFGEEEYKKTEQLINEKGITYIPIMYLLPIFPDDMICLVVGSMKFKWWLHMVYAALGKSVGTATIVFGVSLIPKAQFLPISVDKLYNWLVLIAVLIVYITVLFKLARWVDKKVTTHIRNKRERFEKERKELEMAQNCPDYIDKEITKDEKTI